MRLSAGPATPAVSEPVVPDGHRAGVVGEAPVAVSGVTSAGAVRTIWTDYLSMLGAQAAFACLSVAGLALSARLLGPQDYGTVVLFLTVVQLFFIVGTKWTFPAIIRFGRDTLIRQGQAGEAVRAWAPLFLGTVALCALGFLLGAPVIARIVGLQSPHAGLYLAVFLLIAVGTAAEQLLQVQGKMKAAAWAPVAGKLAFVVLLAACSAPRGVAATPALVIRCFAWAMMGEALLSVACLGRGSLQPGRFDWGLTRTMARYALLSWAGFFAAYVSESIDLYFLRFFRGHAEIGVYQVSYQVFLFLTAGLTVMYTLMFPLLTAWMAEGREDRVRRYAVRFAPQACVFWGVLVLGVGVIHTPCFSWLFGSGFAMSGRLFSILLVSSAIQPIFFLYGPLFLAHDRPGQHTLVVIAMAVVNAVGDLALVPRYGAVGAACATAASFAVRAWLCLSWGNRTLGIDRTAVLVPSAIMVASVSALIGQPFGVRAAIFAAATGLLVWWVRGRGMFSGEDLRMLERVQCPSWVAAGARRVYGFLSLRPVPAKADGA